MAQTTKRSPDKCKIREITTYSVSQLSQKMGKSEATIMTWIGQGGLPTIDDQKPILVYGWAFRKWHQEWWASRKKPCGPLEFYCCKCATRTPATAGTIRFSESSPGNQRGVAVCSICGQTVFRNFNVKQAMETMAASVALLNPTPGFVDSHTTTDTLGLHPDSVVDGNSVVKTPIKARSANLPCNPRNERLKRRFFEFEHHARGKSEKSIQSYEIAVLRFESFLRFRDFGSLTKDEAIAFKAHLKAGPLTTPVIKATLKTVISMLKWLLGQNGYKRKTSFETLEYLNLTAKERRMSDSMEKVVSAPSPDEVDQLIRSMPTRSLVDRRNRAIVALIGMTAIRSGVIPKLRLKHLDLELGLLHQRSSEVDTKFSKSNTSILLPLKDGWLEILHAYVSELQTLGYIADNPLFPKTTVSRGKGVALVNDQSSRNSWPMRRWSNGCSLTNSQRLDISHITSTASGTCTLVLPMEAKGRSVYCAPWVAT
jgi:site-specific recombinase XerD